MLHAALLAAFLTAQTADTGSTLRLMSHGYAEGNPFMPSSPAGIVAVKATVMTGVSVYAWKIRKRHPKLAALLLVVGCASGSFGAAMNARHH